MSSKRRAIKDHARKRFAQRAGVQLTKKLHDELVLQIASGKAKHLLSESNRVRHFEVDLPDGSKRVVVYDRVRGLIVTILPEDAAVTYERKVEA